jgi:hypothetical protein
VPEGDEAGRGVRRGGDRGISRVDCLLARAARPGDMRKRSDEGDGVTFAAWGGASNTIVFGSTFAGTLLGARDNSLDPFRLQMARCRSMHRVAIAMASSLVGRQAG